MSNLCVKVIYYRFKEGIGMRELATSNNVDLIEIENIIRAVAVGIDIGVEYARWNAKDE